MDTLHWFLAQTNSTFRALISVQECLTFRADLAYFFHVVLGAIVDGMRDPTLADGLVLAGGCRTEHSDVLHCAAQLSGCDTYTT